MLRMIIIYVTMLPLLIDASAATRHTPRRHAALLMLRLRRHTLFSPVCHAAVR